MAKSKHPVTPAIRVLRAEGVDFTPHLYDYEEGGGTRHSSAELGVNEHQVIKTLVMQTETEAPLLVLMHGDREVSTKQLARQLGVKSIEPCTPKTAQRWTGYLIGGTSPFGTRSDIPVYMETSIAELDLVVINGGKRGFLVELKPSALIDVLHPTLVTAATQA